MTANGGVPGSPQEIAMGGQKKADRRSPIRYFKISKTSVFFCILLKKSCNSAALPQNVCRISMEFLVTFYLKVSLLHVLHVLTIIITIHYA